MSNEDLSWTVDVPVCTVKRIRINLIEFSDIFSVMGSEGCSAHSEAGSSDSSPNAVEKAHGRDGGKQSCEPERRCNASTAVADEQLCSSINTTEPKGQCDASTENAAKRDNVWG